MNRALVRVLLAAVAVSLAWSTASAQSLPVELTPGLPVGGQAPLQAPFTIVPSLTVTEEYNDNIFLDNRDRRSDFITGFTPGVVMALQTAAYRLTAAYNFTAEIYAKNSDLNDAFARQNFSLDGLYRVSPTLVLTLTDRFIVDKATSLVSTEGVSTGRERSWSNTVTPGLAWQVNPLTVVRVIGGYTVLRFKRADLFDSDLYRVDVAVERTLTPRLTGIVGYQFGFFDIERTADTFTHTPRVGFSYRLTETLTAAATAGPTFVVTDDATRRGVWPSASVSIVQLLPFGSVGGGYERFVGTAGGLGGTTNNQSFSAFVRVLTLLRGLTIDVVPRYTTVKSVDHTIDVRVFSLPLQVRYQFNPWLTGVASYTLYYQRSDSTSAVGTLVSDVDQNRLFVGLQFGYPIKFD